MNKRADGIDTTKNLVRYRRDSGLTPKFLSDGGPEFDNTHVLYFMSHYKIEHKFIAAEEPWQNGAFEKRIGLLKEAVKRCVEDLQEQALEINLENVVYEANAIINEQPSIETLQGGVVIIITIAIHSFLKLKKS